MHSDLEGIVLADKPASLGSTALVGKLKRTLGLRAGHCGTLDRFASGLMLLVTGRATAFAEILLHQDKRYRAVIQVGRATDTLDPTGQTLEEVAPAAAQSFMKWEGTPIRAAVAALTGVTEQVPPVYSALKTGGRRYSDRARQGLTTEPPPRAVRIYDIGPAGGVQLDDDRAQIAFELSVSSGTYIRAIARDLGRELGIPMHLAELRRLRIGRFTLEQPGVWQPGLDATGPSGPQGLTVRSALEAFPEWPRLTLEASEQRQVSRGMRPASVLERLKDLDLGVGADFFLVGPAGELVAWVQRAEASKGFSYRRVFASEPATAGPSGN